jgi:phosphocarrier protein FPr/phosphocarrier protein
MPNWPSNSRLAAKAKSLISPVVIANGEAFAVVSRTQDRLVAAGDVLMEIVPLAEAGKTSSVPQQTISQTVQVASEHGLHARPAALLANAARRFAGDVTISCGGRSASAKSAVAVMALGVRNGDEVTITAASREAVEPLAALLRSEPQKAAEVLKPAAAVSALPANSATRIHGVPAAPGRALGRVVRLRNRDIEVPESGRGLAQEAAAFRQALAELRARLERAVARGGRDRREILSAHLSFLDDANCITTLSLIEEGKSAFAGEGDARLCRCLRAMDDARCAVRHDIPISNASCGDPHRRRQMAKSPPFHPDHGRNPA